MEFSIGLENNNEGRSLAWVLGHPGCFAYGADGASALAAAPDAIRSYLDWIAFHSESWFSVETIEVKQVDCWEAYDIDADYHRVEQGSYSVNAWFQDDWLPLSEQEISRGLVLLDWCMADLLAAVKNLSLDALQVKRPGERWSIAGILQHVGGAEWWYLHRLGLAIPRESIPQDPFERLEKVRANLVDVLPGLIESRQVVGVDGEFWSPRKLLRRAAWHIRDHTVHIQKLV